MGHGAQDFIVHLAGGLSLDIQASTASMACESVRQMHESLGNAIVMVELFTGEFAMRVLGRCTHRGSSAPWSKLSDCGAWVFESLEVEPSQVSREVLCDRCRLGTPKKRGPPPGYHRPFKPTRVNRKPEIEGVGIGNGPDGD